MKWYTGYILAAGQIAIGAKRENGTYVPIDNQKVFVNPENGVALKIEKHMNKELDKEIVVKQFYALGGTSDNDFYLFENSECLNFDEVLKV